MLEDDIKTCKRVFNDPSIKQEGRIKALIRVANNDQEMSILTLATLTGIMRGPITDALCRSYKRTACEPLRLAIDSGEISALKAHIICKFDTREQPRQLAVAACMTAKEYIPFGLGVAKDLRTKKVEQ